MSRKRTTRSLILSATVLTVGMILFTTPVQADVVGRIWLNTGGLDASTIPADSLNLPNATFVAPQINFDSNSTGYTPFSFLNNVVFSNLLNGFDQNQTLNNSFVLLTGSLQLNTGANTFDVLHDDGVVLTVNGTNVLNAPGATAAASSPFTVTVPTAGAYPFQLQYSEIAGPPAVLQFNVNSNPVTGTPEPASFALLTSGIGAGLLWLRRRKTAV